MGSTIAPSVSSSKHRDPVYIGSLLEVGGCMYDQCRDLTITGRKTAPVRPRVSTSSSLAFLVISVSSSSTHYIGLSLSPLTRCTPDMRSSLYSQMETPGHSRPSTLTRLVWRLGEKPVRNNDFVSRIEDELDLKEENFLLLDTENFSDRTSHRNGHRRPHHNYLKSFCLRPVACWSPFTWGLE